MRDLVTEQKVTTPGGKALAGLHAEMVALMQLMPGVTGTTTAVDRPQRAQTGGAFTDDGPRTADELAV